AKRLGADRAQVMLADYTGPQYETETRVTASIVKFS
ncbi:hypothetical protein SOVF_126890, partial [Spinacia oleracea]